MKIYGTAKGGALSTKDFGVAFGGAAAGCSNFADSLGTDANGQVTGAEINTDDQKLGSGCVFFDGNNDFINLGDAGSGLGGTSAFSTNVGSITMWINPADTTRSDTIFSWGDTSANVYLAIKTDGTSLFVGLYEGGGWRWEAIKSGLVEDTWTWLAIVQDGTAVKWYMNNEEQTFASEVDRTAWVTNSVGVSVMDNCRAGCVNNSLAGNRDYFPGLLDDIGIWDFAITESIRNHLWDDSDGKPISSLPSCDNIKAYYNCDELDNSTFTNNGVPV